jgi:hypothetical protein
LRRRLDHAAFSCVYVAVTGNGDRLPKQVEPHIDYSASAMSFMRDKIRIFKYFLDESEALRNSSLYKQENRLKSSAISLCPFFPFPTFNTSQGYLR